MKFSMFALAGAAGLAMAAAASAGVVNPYYATGDWNTFTFQPGEQMTQIDAVKWSKTYTIAAGSPTATTLPPTTRYNGKAARAGFVDETPPFGQAARIETPASGSITFNAFDQTTWSDGWLPNDRRRFGYSGTSYGWDVMGSWNSFSSPIDMINVGGEVFEGQIVLNAGTYDFKFRKDGDWDINIGDNAFGNNNGNVFFTADANATYTFRLDLPNGRFQVIPAPGAAALMGIGGLVAIRRRRK